MTFLYIMIALAICVFGSIGIWCFFDYKKIKLEYEKVVEKQTSEISIKAVELEIEKENTKQMELNSNAFIEKQRVIKAKEDSIKSQEETKHLKIKTEYREKYNDRLF